MKPQSIKRCGIETGVLAGLVLAIMLSVLIGMRALSVTRGTLDDAGRLDAVAPQYVSAIEFRSLDAVLKNLTRPVRYSNDLSGLLIGELRVAAIGSAYPIPYDAEICPYTSIPQPAMNQLDRDSDGITDDWELEYGLDKYNAGDADMDMDGDGFNNLEEFIAGTLPNRADSHPPYAKKMRFVELKEIPFPFVFDGITELQGGSVVFQLNDLDDGKSHFAAVGESVEDIVIEGFISKTESSPARLLVRRGDLQIELIRGRKTVDPESKAELINILDRSREIVTMGALLSFRDNTYAVLGVQRDKVVLQDTETGDVYDIVGLTKGE